MSLEIGFVEPIEGYLSSKENFNGVLFILKEPNTDDQESFWFKNCFDNPPDCSDEKRVFTKWRNTFERLLTYCPDIDNCKVTDCAFANIRPQNGESQASEDYKKLSNKEMNARVQSLINYCSPKYVFTCFDQINAIVEITGIKPTNDGVKYSKKQLRKLVLNKDVTVYEIYHPTRSAYPDKEETNL